MHANAIQENISLMMEKIVFAKKAIFMIRMKTLAKHVL
jgi:hypothetical protein